MTLMTSSLTKYFSHDIVTQQDHIFSKSFFWCKRHGENAFTQNSGRRRRTGENFFKNKGRGISIRHDDMWPYDGNMAGLIDVTHSFEKECRSLVSISPDNVQFAQFVDTISFIVLNCIIIIIEWFSAKQSRNLLASPIKNDQYPIILGINFID